LIYLDLYDDRIPNMRHFSNLSSSVKTFKIYGATIQSEGMEEIEHVEHLIITGPQPDGIGQVNLGRSVKTLLVSGGTIPHIYTSAYNTIEMITLYNSQDMPSLDALPSSLKTLILDTLTAITTFNAPLPPSLEHLEIKSCELLDMTGNGLGGLENLTTYLVSGVQPNFYNGLPSLTGRTKLKHLRFGLMQFDEVSLTNFLCNSVPHASLERLELPFLQPSMTVIPCLGSFTHLKHLDITNHENMVHPFLHTLPETLEVLIAPHTNLPSPSDWSELVTILPNLQEIDMSFNNLTGPFPAALEALKLRKLDLSFNSLSGSVPSLLLFRVPTLQTFILTNNSVSGAIPWIGLGNLTELRAGNNLFTDWPPLYPASGAPLLQTLEIHNNQLNTIPDNPSFATMVKLVDFNVYGNSDLYQPLPTFWANHSNLRNLLASNCTFTGTVPSQITSPQLFSVQLNNNALCGSLPSFPKLTLLNELYLQENVFNSPIPASWKNLVVFTKLDLSSNELDGTIPEPFLYSPTIAQQVSLAGNPISGNMTAFMDVGGVNWIDVSNTNIDPCGYNNTFDNVNVCVLSNLPVSWCNCSAYWPSCETVTQCPSGVGSAPMAQPPSQAGSCFTPPYQSNPSPSLSPSIIPMTPTSGVSCPLPAPQGNFQCVNGVWRSLGSISEPVFAVPVDGHIVIDGNFTVINTISITGINSQIVVSGCIFLGGTQVEIQLSDDDLTKLSKNGKTQRTLLTSASGNNCPESTDLKSTVVSIKGDPKGCKKVKTENKSTKDSLAVLFAIDNSKCNVVIIVPAVVGGVIVITAAILIAYIAIKRPYGICGSKGQSFKSLKTGAGSSGSAASTASASASPATSPRK
jgi:hypothetical protein